MTGRNAAALITDGVLIISALFVVALLVRREARADAGSRPSNAHVPAALWEESTAGGHVLGSASAPVKVVEFGDLQCPACAVMNTEVRYLLTNYAGQVAFVWHHWPLAVHPQAVAAALAAECAAAQGRFDAFSDTLFAEQQWIGVDNWIDFAREAGVPDSAAFERCVGQRMYLDRIKHDMMLARKVGVAATPSFLIEGQLFSGLSATNLKSRVRDAIDKYDKVSR